MFKSIKEVFTKIHLFFFNLNQLTIVIANCSFKETKAIFTYYIKTKLIAFEKDDLYLWVENFRERAFYVIFFIPSLYVVFSILDYYLCLGETELLSFNSIEEDNVGFLEMSFFYEAGDWAKLGSWELMCAWPVLTLYAIVAMLSLTVHRITSPLILVWYCLLIDIFSEDNTLFWEFLYVTNFEDYLAWWLIYAISGSLAWALMDHEFETYDEKEKAEYGIEKAAYRGTREDLFDYIFKDDLQYITYEDIVFDQMKYYAFNQFAAPWARDVARRHFLYFTLPNWHKELLFMMESFGLSGKLSLTEHPEEARRRYFNEADEFDLKQILTNPDGLDPQYQICPSSIRTEDLEATIIAFRKFYRGTSARYFKKYYLTLAKSKWLKRSYYLLFLIAAKVSRYYGPRNQGPIIWDPLVLKRVLNENPAFVLSTADVVFQERIIKEWDNYSLDLFPYDENDIIIDYELRKTGLKNYITWKSLYNFWNKPKPFKFPWYFRFKFRLKRSIRYRKHRLYIEFWMHRTYKKNFKHKF